MKARPLPPGGTIGVPAPAGPWDERSEVDRGVRWWESRGYRVKLAEGIWDRDDYVAGDPKARARDLQAMFEDPEVDVLDRELPRRLRPARDGVAQVEGRRRLGRAVAIEILDGGHHAPP